jgi:hypothetical protein
MSSGGRIDGAARQLFDEEEVEGVLSGAFYRADREEAPAEKPKPTHYKVICISMYVDALARLDEMVRELKRRGFTKANRSALIRHALETMDLDDVPRGL